MLNYSSGLLFRSPERQIIAPDSYFEVQDALDSYFEGPRRRITAPDSYFEGPELRITAPDSYFEVQDAEL